MDYKIPQALGEDCWVETWDHLHHSPGLLVGSLLDTPVHLHHKVLQDNPAHLLHRGKLVHLHSLEQEGRRHNLLVVLWGNLRD